MFEKYEEVLPGSADRILGLAEKEQNIRDRDNLKMLRNDATKVHGSIFISLSLVIGACVCAYLGQPWLGVVLGASGMVSGMVSGVVPSVIRVYFKSSGTE